MVRIARRKIRRHRKKEKILYVAKPIYERRGGINKYIVVYQTNKGWTTGKFWKKKSDAMREYKRLRRRVE